MFNSLINYSEILRHEIYTTNLRKFEELIKLLRSASPILEAKINDTAVNARNYEYCSLKFADYCKPGSNEEVLSLNDTLVNGGNEMVEMTLNETIQEKITNQNIKDYVDNLDGISDKNKKELEIALKDGDVDKIDNIVKQTNLKNTTDSLSLMKSIDSGSNSVSLIKNEVTANFVPSLLKNPSNAVASIKTSSNNLLSNSNIGTITTTLKNSISTGSTTINSITSTIKGNYLTDLTFTNTDKLTSSIKSIISSSSNSINLGIAAATYSFISEKADLYLKISS